MQLDVKRESWARWRDLLLCQGFAMRKQRYATCAEACLAMAGRRCVVNLVAEAGTRAVGACAGALQRT